MKITPFQIALQHEIKRLESLSNDYVQGNHALVACAQVKSLKQPSFLVQLFRGRVQLRSSLRVSY